MKMCEGKCELCGADIGPGQKLCKSCTEFRDEPLFENSNEETTGM